ncbi:MAG TPA: NUDIX hydrolase [Nakamurella sp.]|nr:NUDIX hydrolase [Nakamurella sp.]
MGQQRATGDDPPVRPASTVMLIRDGPRGLEVFTLRRVAGMAFAGGMTAFPGGAVDPADADPTVPWHGPGPDWWAAQWDIGVPEARRQVVAAVRELFEETAILLAGSDTDVVSGDPAVREADRQALTTHRRSLAEVLRATGQRLRADLLRPWARWITPPGQTRRYDTYFFVAALPAGQRASAVTTEASAGQWERPAEVLDAGRAGRIGMLPPTVAMLTDLSSAAGVAEVLATPRQVRPVTPIVLSADGEVLRVLAGDREIQARVPPAAPVTGRTPTTDPTLPTDPEDPA